MEKGKIVIIACTIVIICIAVGVTLYVTVGSKKSDKDKKKELANKVEKEYGKLVKMEYTITGGDLPGSYNLVIAPEGDDYKLTRSDDRRGQKESSSKELSKKKFQDLTDCINKYKMYEWKDLEDCEYQALDAASSIIILTYEKDGKTNSVTFSDQKDFPKDGIDGFNELRSKLNFYANVDLEGDWQCQEKPEQEEYSDIYVGYIFLCIEDDGSFSMYDAEAGNPGISGTLTINFDGTMTLDCSDSKEFDPPTSWGDMKKVQDVTYEYNGDVLKLTFDNGKDTPSTLIFERCTEVEFDEDIEENYEKDLEEEEL